MSSLHLLRLSRRTASTTLPLVRSPCRLPLLPLPAALPACSHCLSSPSPLLPTSSLPSVPFRSYHPSRSSDDSGAEFEVEGQQQQQSQRYPKHPQDEFTPSDDDLSPAATGSFMAGRQAHAQGGTNLGILAPRARGGQGGNSSSPSSSSAPRADDPSATMLAAINRMAIKVDVDHTVPVGKGSKGEKSERKMPQKGGRPIAPAQPIEQSGRVTPLQLHRIAATLQLQSEGRGDPDWSIDRIASAYQLDPATMSSIQKYVRLPYVTPQLEGLWEGTPHIPHAVQIKRTLGEKVEIEFLGQHLGIDKPKQK